MNTELTSQKSVTNPCPWDVALDDETVWLWRGRGENAVWIARGESAVHSSLSECRQALRSQRINDDRFELHPRAFGALAFDPDDPLSGIWQGFRQEFTLPRIVARVAHNAISARFFEPTPLEKQILADALFKPRHENPLIPSSLTRRFVPERETWMRSVEEIRKAIRSGQLSKVVLSRIVEIYSSQPFDVNSIVEHLASESTGCDLFVHFRPKAGCFLGASPERLFEANGSFVVAESLAGSRPRGSTTNLDREFESSLLSSGKDRAEHDIVTRFLLEQLENLSVDVSSDHSPRIRKLDTVQHLSSNVTAVLAEMNDDADVLQRLHPTPAVCGYPRNAARELIRRHERHPRGLFAGTIGWLETHCSTFSVAIRSALIRHNVAYVFAGAGIVADSDPETEWAETEWKMLPMLRALGVA